MAARLDGNDAAGDRPPDPEAAAASAREARRRIAASQGIVKVVLGLVFLVAFLAVRLLTRSRTEAEIDTVILLVLALVAAEVLLPLVVGRMRRRRGLTAVGRLAAETERYLARTRTLLLLGVLGAGAALAAAVLIICLDAAGVSDDWTAGFDTAVILVCTAAAVLLLGARWRDLRLPEDLLMALGIAATGALLAFAREVVRVETPALIMAGATLLAGLSLHRRWRRWVRSLPHEDAAPGVGEVRP